MIRTLIITVSLFSLAISAQAKAPSLLPVQGTVADGDGQPLDGEFTVQFSLYSDALGGDALYQETQPVNFRNGHFFAYVGDGGTLDLSIFKNNDAIYLGLKMGEDPEMRPRILLASAAYAAYADNAGNAEKLAGKNADEYALKSETATLAWNKVTDIPAGIADGIDNDTTYTASTGLALDGTRFSVNQSTIEAWARGVAYDTEAEITTLLEQYYSSTGSGNVSWSSLVNLPPTLADGIDDNTTYTASTGITLNGTNFSVDQSMIEDWIRTLAYDDIAELRADLDRIYLTQSSSITWAGLVGMPAGFSDGTDNDTTYNAGEGLLLSGVTFSANQSTIEAWARGVAYDTEAELTTLLDDNYLGSGYVPAWGTLSGIPAGFADGTDNDTTYSAGTGLDLSGTQFAVNQSTIEAWARGVAYDTETEIRTVLDQYYSSTGNGKVSWSNISNLPPTLADGVDDDTTYSAGNGLALNGTQFAVNQTTIEAWARGVAYDTEAELTNLLDDNYLASGYVPAWATLSGIPAGFADGTDNDTTYTASTGLALDGTRFSVNQTTIEAWARDVAYDTEAEITPLLDQYYSSTGSGNVSWSNISNLPPTLADGVDDDTTYAAGNGLALNGTTFSANQSTIEAWTRGVAYDTEAELTNLLDDNYLGSGYVPAWGNLSDIPAGFADGTDNDTTYTAGNGLDLSGTQFAVNQSTIEAWARGVAYDTEAEITPLLDQYYSSTGSGNVSWSNISNLPPTLADGVDDDTTYAAGNGLALNGTTFSANQSTIEAWARGVAYDTEAELTNLLDDNYLGSGYVPAWANLSGMPADFADGIDNDTTYTASTGLALDGNQFRINQSTIEAWARDVAYDTEAELRTILDQYYSSTGSGNVSWSNISNLPPTLADGVDDDTTYAAGNGLALNGTTFSANQSTIEAWARGVAYDTEAELTNLLDDNYLGSGYVPAWTNLSGMPADFADGTDNDTTYTAGNGLDLSGTTLSVNQTTIEAWARGVAYDTEAEITPLLDQYYSSTGSGNVSWSNISNLPASLADGIDNDTTYSAGTGLDLSGTTLSVNQSTIEAWARGVAYDTEAELTNLLDDNYLGSGYLPAWANLTDIPAGFADGTDNDTTYAAGTGLDLSGTSFSVNQSTIETWVASLAYTEVAQLRAALDAVYLNESSTVAWANVTGIPASFADGVDDDTTYTASGPITLNGTEINMMTCQQDEVLQWDSGAWTCASLPSTNSPSGTLQVCRVGSSTCLGTYTHQRLVGSFCDNDFIACGTYYYLAGTGADATPRSVRVWNMANTSLYYSRVRMTTDGRTYYENPDCDESGDKYIEESGRNAYAASFRWAIAAERGSNEWYYSYRDSSGCTTGFSSGGGRRLLSDARELRDSGTGLRAYELRMQ